MKGFVREKQNVDVEREKISFENFFEAKFYGAVEMDIARCQTIIKIKGKQMSNTHIEILWLKE